MAHLYRISELAAEAGVSVRTVRYYIQEGLLPAPDRKGRHTTYTQEHLDRLRLIAALKDAFLPLDEIRVRLEGLSHAQVRELLSDSDENDPLVLREETTLLPSGVASDIADTGFVSRMAFAREAIAEQDQPQDSAREYVRRVLADRPQSAPTFGSAREIALSESQGSEWERHALKEGIELHVRRPMDRDTRKKISRLLALARDLFRE